MIDDEKMIELFFERSEQGIRELDMKYGKMIHNLSYNIVNNRQDAEECVNYKKKVKKSFWVKWGAVAACFAVVVVLGVGVLQSGLFGNKTDIAILENGAEIVFAKSEMMASSFPNLPVTAHLVFRTGDTDEGNSTELIGLEGNIGNINDAD